MAPVMARAACRMAPCSLRSGEVWDKSSWSFEAASRMAEAADSISASTSPDAGAGWEVARRSRRASTPVPILLKEWHASLVRPRIC
jgi:hypothetical protein